MAFLAQESPESRHTCCSRGNEPPPLSLIHQASAARGLVDGQVYIAGTRYIGGEAAARD